MERIAGLLSGIGVPVLRLNLDNPVWQNVGLISQFLLTNGFRSKKLTSLAKRPSQL
jgi:hypothetical protein